MNDSEIEKSGKYPRGRPSTYSPELAAVICEKLTSGESLNKICKSPDMPALSTVYLWLQKHSEFSENYDKARDNQADTLADEILHISDSVPTIRTKEGQEQEADSLTAVKRAALKIDSRKWVASKLKPKKYGDNRQMQISHGFENMTLEQTEQRIRVLLEANPELVSFIQELHPHLVPALENFTDAEFTETEVDR